MHLIGAWELCPWPSVVPLTNQTTAWQLLNWLLWAYVYNLVVVSSGNTTDMKDINHKEQNNQSTSPESMWANPTVFRKKLLMWKHQPYYNINFINSFWGAKHAAAVNGLCCGQFFLFISTHLGLYRVVVVICTHTHICHEHMSSCVNFSVVLFFWIHCVLAPYHHSPWSRPPFPPHLARSTTFLGQTSDSCMTGWLCYVFSLIDACTVFPSQWGEQRVLAVCWLLSRKAQISKKVTRMVG